MIVSLICGPARVDPIIISRYTHGLRQMMYCLTREQIDHNEGASSDLYYLV
jgi:hypothetical protein